MSEFTGQQVVLLGGAQVGKTAMLKRFLFHQFPAHHQATIEDVFCKKFSVNSESTFEVHFVDTSGSFNFPAMRRLAVSKASAFVLVFSVTDAASLELLRELVQQIREERPHLARRDNPYAPLVVVANKVDAEPDAWQVTREGVRAWLMEQDIPVSALFYISCILPSSASVPESVWHVFAHLWTLQRESERHASVLEEFTQLEDLEITPEIGAKKNSVSSSSGINALLKQNKSSTSSSISTGPNSSTEQRKSNRRFSAFAVLSSSDKLNSTRSSMDLGSGGGMPMIAETLQRTSTLVHRNNPAVTCQSGGQSSTRRKSSLTAMAGVALQQLFTRRPQEQCKTQTTQRITTGELTEKEDNGKVDCIIS